MVLYNGSSTTLDCQNACHLTDDILGGCPSRQFASQPNSNHLRDHESGNICMDNTMFQVRMSIALDCKEFDSLSLSFGMCASKSELQYLWGFQLPW